MKGMLRKGVFGVTMAATLGFGATQALAAPGEAAARRVCDAYHDALCNDWCQSRRYDAGWCDPIYVGGCKCVHY
jgi:hypothetical protein